MALCCIGGVCVPYTAIVPLIIIGLKWLLEKLVTMGIIPSAWVDRVNAALNGRLAQTRGPGALAKKCDGVTTKEVPSTCCSSNSSECGDESYSLVRTVGTEEEWDALVAGTNKVAVVKFTADWCQPCKAIHPAFCQLAKSCTSSEFFSRTASAVVPLFATVDVDELDSVAAQYGIAILPTFAVFRSGKLANRYTGSDASRLEEFIQQEIGSQ
jgi:thioredoxin 1